MKVKVAYTVECDEVPNLANEIINKCRTTLKRCSEFNFDITRLEKTVEEVSKVQNNLELVSAQLEDCLNLCHGYATLQQGEKEQASKPLEKSEAFDEQNETG